MASRIYFRGSEVGNIMLNESVLSYTNDSGYIEDQITSAISAFREKMHAALSDLDTRLWWQPETSEIFLEEDGSEKPIPFENDPDGFIDWWNDKTAQILEEVCTMP